MDLPLCAVLCHTGDDMDLLRMCLSKQKRLQALQASQPPANAPNASASFTGHSAGSGGSGTLSGTGGLANGSGEALGSAGSMGGQPMGPQRSSSGPDEAAVPSSMAGSLVVRGLLHRRFHRHSHAPDMGMSMATPLGPLAAAAAAKQSPLGVPSMEACENWWQGAGVAGGG